MGLKRIPDGGVLPAIVGLHLDPSEMSNIILGKSVRGDYTMVSCAVDRIPPKRVKRTANEGLRHTMTGCGLSFFISRRMDANVLVFIG